MNAIAPPLDRSWLVRGLAALCAAVSLPVVHSCAANLPTKTDDRLMPVFESNRIWVGVTTTPDGRVFVNHPNEDGPGVQVEEITPGRPVAPFPDESWNTWKPGRDFSQAFVRINALRIGPDGNLWIVDAGATGQNEPAVPGAGRIIKVDLKTNRVARVYSLRTALRDNSYVDDIRFHGDLAYISDAGMPGIIVLDLKSGATRRLLNGVPTTTDQRPMYADGRLLVDENGKEVRIHADQLEVSPDGKYFYYQPCSGPLARIETRWLDDASISPAEVDRHAEQWVDTPTTGGTAIDAAGNIYLSDTDAERILKITPAGEVSTLVSDPRPVWSDAMRIDDQGLLWIPATQLSRAPGFNGGKNEVQYPVHIYKMQIDSRPPVIDHP